MVDREIRGPAWFDEYRGAQRMQIWLFLTLLTGGWAQRDVTCCAVERTVRDWILGGPGGVVGRRGVGTDALDVGRGSGQRGRRGGTRSRCVRRTAWLGDCRDSYLLETVCSFQFSPLLRTTPWGNHRGQETRRQPINIARYCCPPPPPPIPPQTTSKHRPPLPPLLITL